MSDSASFPSAEAALSSNTTPNELNPSSYTSQRLKHASPEHLHTTSRRFFIGPIPEGWLQSNRKSWYKRRIELLSSISREHTFDAVTQAHHKRTVSITADPSLSARVAVSFPQPTDVYSPPTTPGPRNGQEDYDQETEDEDEDETSSEVETRVIAPISTIDTTESPENPEGRGRHDPRYLSVRRDKGVRGIDETLHQEPFSAVSIRAESWKTAQETPLKSVKSNDALDETSDDSRPNASDVGLRPSTSVRTGASSRIHPDGLGELPDDVDNSSKTALLAPDSPNLDPEEDQQATSNAMVSPKTIAQRSMTHHSPAPIRSPQILGESGPKAPGVRFKVAEEVAHRKQRLGRRAGNARNRVAYKASRRVTLQEGTIIKMERMLVRLDVTMQQLPDDFDENESLKTETRPVEKWREFMVVARKSTVQEDEDFRLQLYKTRVIPEIENEKTKKKPAREIKLLHKSTHVNLYSSLDKTIVLWHPYRKGTRIAIMKPSSAAHAVEWYTFIRDALGSHRPTDLQVNVPDLDVVLHVERPFEILTSTEADDEDEQTFLARAAAVEQAVAQKVISQSMDMLALDSEWSRVLQKWSETAKMGLAWKRYDRLEWVHGVNEQRMYGSMAMQHSYDLELRPKQHYPTEVHGKKGKLHQEPAPVEGFLIRLTSQKGLHKRLGKAFFKRLYFSSHDGFLIFNRPAKAIPPHPPRLATLESTHIPSAADIVRQTPTMFEVDPYELDGGDIKWLKPNRQDAARRNDLDAREEAQRNIKNIAESDGYINMCHVAKIRKLKWGAGEADDVLESGSEVDFHIEVDNTSREDGTTTVIDDERIFELVLTNGLIIRLQAYSVETRDEWMRRLRKLVKYWRLRSAADIGSLKSVRASNLRALNIDEEMEARIGQFARKWEVSYSEASPELYNMCRLTGCRAITMSGVLYRKPRRHSTFQQCSVFLTGGQMLIYQAMVRKGTGEQIAHIHQEKQEVVDLQDCYCYSGLIVEEDLLYQNRTFDANQPGMLAATPRVYPIDGWTAADVDVMTCFVIWMNRRKGWFRSVSSRGPSNDTDPPAQRSKLRRVAQLGVPGRGMVFKCRSRAERDLWVTSVSAEIETAVEKAHCRKVMTGDDHLGDVRFEH